MARAAWALTVRRRFVDAKGTAHLEAELTDAGQLAATLLVTITADRDMTVRVNNAPGAAGLALFRAWEV